MFGNKVSNLHYYADCALCSICLSCNLNSLLLFFSDNFKRNVVSEFVQISNCLEHPGSLMRDSSLWNVCGTVRSSLDSSSTISFPSLFSTSSCFGGSERGNSLSPTSSIGVPFSRMSPTFSEKDFPALPSVSANHNLLRFPMQRNASEESTTSSLMFSDSANHYLANTAAVNIESGYSSGKSIEVLCVLILTYLLNFLITVTVFLNKQTCIKTSISYREH